MFCAKQNQDRWVLDTLKYKSNGYFVDIGASGGKTNSNTWALEKKYNWKGICVEPNPNLRAFPELVNNRSCICENVCIFSKNTEVDFIARGRKIELSGIYADFSNDYILSKIEKKHPTIKIKTITLIELLKKHNAPKTIDYLSVSTEGSEWEILKNFDFNQYSFLTITIKNHYNSLNPNEKNKIRRDEIRKLLIKHNYILVKEFDFGEDWFVLNSIQAKAPLFWNALFSKPIIVQNTISFCTTCMGRLYNLKDTLPINIKENEDYPNLEFVILDYNSNDNLWDWMKKNMSGEIEKGRVSYYRTTEPTDFSMSHSRNIAFKLAKGDIVNNLDADNFTLNSKRTATESWASYLNKMANQQQEKVIFAKGKSAMRGRIGFYKKEFIELLGGYDEDLLGYGHDDHDLVDRAFALGFTMYWWGGQYCSRIKTSRIEKNQNLERHWKITENENKIKSEQNIQLGKFKANENKHWGKAKLIKNFSEEIEI